MSSLLEQAESLTRKVDGSSLSLLRSKTDFQHHDFSNLTDSALFLSPSDPTLVAHDVAAQLSFLRKLKFHYTEQNAKGRYIRTIVSDVDPGISQQTHHELQASNVQLKKELKESKTHLASTYQNIRDRAPRLEQSYDALRKSSAEASKLVQEILDAQLALSRLRAGYPEPRLSVSAASAMADEQIEKMQELENEMQDMQTQIAEAKDQNKAAMREIELLRSEKAKAESEVDTMKVEGEEDNRILGLYDWFSASLALHKSILSIDSIEYPSSNELRITYLLPEPVVVALIFQPNTHKLAEARLVDPQPPFDIDIVDLVAVYTMNGDVSGFLSALLARLRHWRGSG